MPVYFIQAGNKRGPVKIGHSDYPRNRLYTFQVHHYQKLSLLREVEGGYDAEDWLHGYFRPLHIRGEWFKFSPEMLAINWPHAERRAA